MSFMINILIPQWITPNRLTIARMLGSIVLLVLGFMTINLGWLILLIVLLCLSDAFDGMLARARGQATPLGAYLDPTADKLFTFVLVIVLCSRGLVDLRLLAMALLVDVHVWLLPLLVWRRRARLNLKLWPPPLIRANIWGKGKTALLSVGMGLVILGACLGQPLCQQTGIIFIIVAVGLGCLASLSYLAAWFKGAYL